MHGRFPYKKLDTYPHMGPNDAALWERFITIFPTLYETVEYDVRVGEGAIREQEVEENVYKQNTKGLTKFRIDVVAVSLFGEIFVIEIRPYAGLSALGHVLGGTHLFERDNNLAPVRPKIITDRAQSDMEEICFAHSVDLVELNKL